MPDPQVAHREASASAAESYTRWRGILTQMIHMPDEGLSRFDIAALNLGCARWLPGAENLDEDVCSETLDTWAELVRANTEHWWPIFARAPAEHNHSPGQFRVLALITVLQKHLGVRYNLPFSEGKYDASDSRDLFLHGVLSGRGGTCVTMPVLYIAIGRRLGYPLKLVQAKEHLFARWDEPDGERFNIECTSPGFVSHDDAYYHRRPRPLTAADLGQGIYLRNLSPREELAAFLYERASCFRDNLRWQEALDALRLADQLAPNNPNVRGAWAITTMMARAIEQAECNSRHDGGEHHCLRDLPWPTPKEDWERWALPHARAHIERIVRIQARKTEHTHGDVPRLCDIARC